MKGNSWIKWSIVGGIALAICVVARVFLRGFYLPKVVHMFNVYTLPVSGEQVFPFRAFVLKVATYDLIRLILTALGLWAGVFIGLRLLEKPIREYKYYKGFVWSLLLIRELPSFVSVWLVNFIRDILLELPHHHLLAFIPGPTSYSDIPTLLLTPLFGGFLFGYLSEDSSYLGGGLIAIIALLFIPPGYEPWAPFFTPFRCIMGGVYGIAGALGVYIANLLKARKKG